MSAAWNLPDGCHPFDIPGNSIAAEHQARHWEQNVREVEQRAREDLLRLCSVPGPIRNAYLEYCADHGIASIPQYVATLERMNAVQWQRTCGLIWQGQFNDPEVA